jgi:WD40 repeat protein
MKCGSKTNAMLYTVEGKANHPAVSFYSLWSDSSGENLLAGDSGGYITMWRIQDSVSEPLAPLSKFSVTVASTESRGSEAAPKACSIRSVCMDRNGQKMLIGTQQCEIAEVVLPASVRRASDVQAVEGRVMVQGHFKDELWGLAVNPVRRGGGEEEYCTVGDDNFLRIWSVRMKRQIAALDMKTMARCCAYSPDGTMIAVGYGGRVGKGKQQQDGMFRVYQRSDLSKLFETRDSKKWISEIKFSNDGRLLAVGSHDNSVYVYSVSQQFKRKFKFSKHNSYISHFDFSRDNRYLQSNCGAYEILFCETDSGKQVMSSAALGDTEWASWTCPLGWPVQGIWPAGADGTDINGVDRSPSGNLIATADDFGKLKLFRFPVVLEKSKYIEYSGHSSHVTNVRWVSCGSDTDDFVLTTGGNDKCVFQWRNIDASAPIQSRSSARRPEAEEVSAARDQAEDDDDSGPGGGDEFMAVKPWKGAIVAPTAVAHPDASRVVQFKAALGEMCAKSNALSEQLLRNRELSTDAYKPLMDSAKVVWDRLCDSGHVDLTAPEQDDLELDFIYGYRGFDGRNNLFYSSNVFSPERLVVYTGASVGITFNPASNVQKFFKGHNNDIVAIAVTTNPSTGEILAATGQMGPSSVLVWGVPSLECKAILPTKQKSINNIAFSKDARLVISISEDNSVVVSDWSSQRIIATAAGEPAPTYHLATSNDATALFLSCGDKHIRVWSLAGKNLTSTKITTTGQSTPQPFLSAAFFSGKWAVGGDDGKIYIIEKGSKSISQSIVHERINDSSKKATKGSKATGPGITALHVNEAIKWLISGAKSGTIVAWSETFERLFSFQIADVVSACPDVIPLASRQIQALSTAMNAQGDVCILVGTRGCDVIELCCNNTAQMPCQPSLISRKDGGVDIRGHCNDELWGLACNPKRPEFITVGDDKIMRKWGIHQRKLLQSATLGVMARACTYDPDAELIAVGFGGRVGTGKQKQDGMIRIYKEATLEQLCEATDAKQWISDIKFSPDGRSLSVGSHNNSIYIYSVSRGQDSSVSLSLRAKFSKHNSYITHFDYSADGRFIQSNCGAYELLFSDASNGKQVTSASELKDVKWSTWTCPLGWPVQGIWPPGADGTDINAVDRSHSGHLIAAADDFGKASLFRYPCLVGAKPVVYSGHSSHVMNVRWTVGDKYLLTAGGNDKTVFQWRHVMDGRQDAQGSGAAGVSSAVHGDSEAEEDDGPGGGDEAGAIKPWLGAIRAPKDPPILNSSNPTTSLELSWVHGYTSATSGEGYRVSSNLFYNSQREIVYPAASLGVRMHVTKIKASGNAPATACSQNYFQGHDDDIVCLAISADRRYVATGQTASKSAKGKGSICIWDSSDCRLLSRLSSCHDRAVVSLAFSPDGSKLISVGQDNSYSHTLWSDVGGGWSRVVQIASLKSDGKQVSGMHTTHTRLTFINANYRSFSVVGYRHLQHLIIILSVGEALV